MVVAYKVHPLTWLMFQRVRTVEWVQETPERARITVSLRAQHERSTFTPGS